VGITIFHQRGNILKRYEFPDGYFLVSLRSSNSSVAHVAGDGADRDVVHAPAYFWSVDGTTLPDGASFRGKSLPG